MNASENQIVVYQPNETVRLDVRLENDTVWLPQLKIAELFGVQKAAISKHVKNIFASGELVRDATVSKMETVQDEGGRKVVRLQEFFNLDVIIAVGYRVNSQRATQFRIWATKVLKTICFAGLRPRWAAKSFPVFSPQSARRHRNAANTAKASRQNRGDEEEGDRKMV